MKKVLFILLLVVLLCPIWNNYLVAFDFKPLDGSVEKKEVAAFNIENWFSTDYQKSVEEYVLLNNSISPFFIRLNNQIDYSFFGNLHVSGGIIGKDMYLYDIEYINAHYGIDYIGHDKLKMYVEKMKFIQDTLKKLNKEFIYIQAPGKVCYFPEFVPDSLQRAVSDQTNYYQLNNLLNEYKINHIDFRDFILKSKSTTPYPLFTQTGIHWSKYATVVVMDSINHFIESSMKIDIPEIYYNEVDIDYARYEDADLEKVMNLLFVISDVKYAYPDMKFESRENKVTPVVTMVGDSYLGNLYWGHFYESFGLQSQFWFYNSSVSSPKINGRIHKAQIDQEQVIQQTDVVIVGCTEPNIKGLGWGFIDEMYDYYKNGIRSADRADHILFMKSVDSCKAVLTDSEIERATEYMQSEKVSLDSAKTIFSIWKMSALKH